VCPKFTYVHEIIKFHRSSPEIIKAVMRPVVNNSVCLQNWLLRDQSHITESVYVTRICVHIFRAVNAKCLLFSLSLASWLYICNRLTVQNIALSFLTITSSLQNPGITVTKRVSTSVPF